MRASLVVMGTDALRRSARATLGRLVRARMDNDVFRWEAAEVLRRAIRFDTWSWVLFDPVTDLPTRYTATNPVIAHNPRRYFDLQSRAACPPPGRTRPAALSTLTSAGRVRPPAALWTATRCGGRCSAPAAWAICSAPPWPPTACAGPT